MSVVKGFGTIIEERLEHAVIHSDQNEPAVFVQLDTEGEMVEIRIADDGPGIPDMDRHVLTEDEEPTALSHGSGLGLWLVHVLVEQSHGNLEVHKNDPRGTVISIRLSAG